MPKYSIKIEIHEDERYLCFTPLPELGSFDTWEEVEDFANWLHDQASIELAEKNKCPRCKGKKTVTRTTPFSGMPGMGFSSETSVTCPKCKGKGRL